MTARDIFTLAASLIALLTPASGQFETLATFPVRNDVSSVMVGDFNRDGSPDLAELSSSGSVGILLANGDGTFRLDGTYTLPSVSFHGATASLRHNGILDLVVGADDVYVLLGNGDGTFQQAVEYSTTTEANMVGTGNFTGGVNTDVVALESVSCYCIEVLPGNGDGTLGAPITTPLPYGMGGYAIAVGDFNNDGNLDVAVGGEAFPNWQVAILLGNGNGTFTPDGFYLLDTAPGAIATGYFTGNKKKIDLAITSGFLAVLLGNGDGTFQHATYLNNGYLPSWVIAQDFDGDGKVDLAASDAGSPPGFLPGVSVYKGNGNGTFQTGVFYLAGQDEEGGQFVAAGDFNHDGKPDLVVVNSVHAQITTLLNTGVVSFSPTTPLNFQDQSVGTTSAAQTLTLTNTGSTELKIQSIKASVEFSVTSTCGSRVAPGAQCTISAKFSPTKKGAKTGTITIIDNASSKPQVIELLGDGTQAAASE